MTEQEFTDLVVELRPRLVGIARRRCGQDAAEDAVQHAVLLVWRAGYWRNADRATTARRLRAGTALRSRDQMRGFMRLRDTQRNLIVLAHKGWKQANTAPYIGAEETQRLRDSREGER